MLYVRQAILSVNKDEFMFALSLKKMFKEHEWEL